MLEEERKPNQTFFSTISTYLTFYKSCLDISKVSINIYQYRKLRFRKYSVKKYDHANPIYIYVILPNTMINSVTDLHAP